MKKTSRSSLDFVLGWGGSKEPWKDVEQGKAWSELEPEMER